MHAEAAPSSLSIRTKKQFPTELSMKQFLIALAVLVAACSTSRPEPGVEATMHSHETAPPAPALQPDEFDAAAPVSVAEAAKAAGEAEATAIYACPMHPEVTSETPGKCPKCGMTLIKRDKK
jgi:hypothetical protein